MRQFPIHLIPDEPGPPESVQNIRHGNDFAAGIRNGDAPIPEIGIVFLILYIAVLPGNSFPVLRVGI